MGLLRWAEEQAATADAWVLSDYAKGVVTPRVAAEVRALARRGGKPLVVDPKGGAAAKYRGASVVKPNLREAERLLRRGLADAAAVRAAGLELRGLLGGSAVLLTCGPRGMWLFEEGSPPLRIAQVARTVYDVTGAGDTVAGALALALAGGARLAEAAELANRAAGLVVGKLGTSTVSPEELLGPGE